MRHLQFSVWGLLVFLLSIQPLLICGTLAVDQLMDDVRKQGGEFHFTVDVNADGIRGVFASRDFAVNDTILAIPFELALWFQPLKSYSYTAEYAAALLSRMHTAVGFNSTYGKFWDTMPSPDEVFCEEMFTPRQIEMLQSEYLEYRVRDSAKNIADIYNGEITTYASRLVPLQEMIGNASVSLETFKYVTCLVASRDFGIERNSNSTVDNKDGDGSSEEEDDTIMMPVADLINYGDESLANVYRYDNITHLSFIADKPIKAGEELFYNYNEAVLHRNDVRLMLYGFVEEQDPPLMAITDLPFFNTTSEDMFIETALTDDPYYGPNGEYNTWGEWHRLKELLDYCTTTEQQDEAMLKNKNYNDWKDMMIIRFRLYRKRAIRRAMNLIKTELYSTAEL